MSVRTYHKTDFLEDTVKLTHCKHAVCQSLTGCVLARWAEDLLGVNGYLPTYEAGVHKGLVVIGIERNWTYPIKRDGKDYVLAADWDNGRSRWRARIDPLPDAMDLFTLNDESRRALLRGFQPIRLTISEFYSWVPQVNQTKVGPCSPEAKAYSIGYNDGLTAKASRIDNYDTPECRRKYQVGYDGGTNRRLSGKVRPTPPRSKRISVL